MSLEENIQELRDALLVTSAMTVRHETRLRDHQQWIEDVELAFARMTERMEEADDKITRIAAAQLLNEERLAVLNATVTRFLEGLQRGGNGHG